MAKNYNKSDFALNKSSETIVYPGASGSYELTKEEFLASDSALTEADYEFWKTLSNDDYSNTARRNTFENKHTVRLEQIKEAEFATGESAEGLALEVLEPETPIHTVANALFIMHSCLTEKQKRRNWKHIVREETMREIAIYEDVGFTKIAKVLMRHRKNK